MFFGTKNWRVYSVYYLHIVPHILFLSIAPNNMLHDVAFHRLTFVLRSSGKQFYAAGRRWGQAQHYYIFTVFLKEN